jgi:hypothetical protein
MLEAAVRDGRRCLIVRFGDFFRPKLGNGRFSRGLKAQRRRLELASDCECDGTRIVRKPDRRDHRERFGINSSLGFQCTKSGAVAEPKQGVWLFLFARFQVDREARGHRNGVYCSEL